MTKNDKKILSFEIFLFLIVQILGIFVAQNIGSYFKNQSLSTQQFNLHIFLASFFLIFGAFFLILKFFPKRKFPFKIIFFLIAFFGIKIFFESFLPNSVALSLTLFLIFLWFFFPLIWIHNLLLSLAIAGIGSVMGLSLNPKIVIFLFALLSIYDFIAVYKTKHMVKLAKKMMESQAILGVIIPQNLNLIFKKLKEIKVNQKKDNFFILGSGDLIFPLIFASSILPQGIEKSLILIFFSSLGIIFGFWLFLKLGKRPMPALPPIAFFSILGYFFGKLFP